MRPSSPVCDGEGVVMWLMSALLGALLGVLTLHRREVYTLPSSMLAFGGTSREDSAELLGCVGSHTEKEEGNTGGR